MRRKPEYTERYRPQFHFTARTNYLNDPNGCVFYDGEYHLFFQHNPNGPEWGSPWEDRTWGHAVSPDLVHWEHLSDAIKPYDGGAIWSGSAVVDEHNTSGFGRDGRPPLVALFAHARKPMGQALAFSTDRGRTWTRYAGGKHVVPNQGLNEAERDPKVFWHAPSGKWIMVLWVEKGRARFFTSADLKEWTRAGDFPGEGFHECPDLLPLPLDGDGRNTKWILHDGSFTYWIGSFDGQSFFPEAGPIPGEFGSNFYAAQTWNNTGRRVVQIAWMRGGEYPGMPFNQQMSFPCELSLRTTPAGARVCRNPVAEIERLRVDCHALSGKRLTPGESLRVGPPGDLFDIEAEVEISPGARFSMCLHDRRVVCAGGQILCLGRIAPLAPVDGLVKLRLLVDRTSIELFGNDGEASMSSCLLPAQPDTGITCSAEAGTVRVRSLAVHLLSSAW